jgi:hypothetical protein
VVRIKFQGRNNQIYSFGFTAHNFFFCIEHILSNTEEFYSYDEEKYKEMIFGATEIVLGYFEFLVCTACAKI